MNEPYLVFGYRASMGPSWILLSAWATEPLARIELERVKQSVMSLREREQAKNPPTRWRFWEKKPHKGLGGANDVPVRWLEVWGANSTGARNPWSFLAVTKLIVQGTVLDQLSEIE